MQKVEVAGKKNGHTLILNFEKISMDDCGAYLQYKWVVIAPAMQKNICGKRKCCLDLIHQDNPFVSPHNNDNKDGIMNIKARDEAECTVAKA